jgi:serine/threonine protein kinase
MAPEALNGAREVGPRADQYALGAVLYECAVGRPPFEGETLLELLKAIAVGDVPAPRSIRPQLSIQLEDAILRAMNGDPNARFESLREFGRAIWPIADERTKTIWARSFGSGRALTLGESPSGLVLLASEHRHEAGLRGSAFGRRRWASLRNLAWAAAFVAAGVFVAPYVLHSPESRTVSALSAPPRGIAPPEPAPYVAPSELQLDRLSSRPGALAAATPPGSNSDAPALEHDSAVGESSRVQKTTRHTLTTRPSAARTPKAPPDRRKRATRPEPVAQVDKSAEEDADLDDMFTTPGPLEGRPTNADNVRELDGLFPNAQGITLGANGAPLPD